MNNQNQSKIPLFLNKGISTPKGIAIIFLALLICGGIVGWQIESLKEEMKVIEVKIIEDRKAVEQVEKEAKIPEIEELMIPTAEEDQGVKELLSVSETRVVDVSFAGTLKDKIFFINSKEEIISEVRAELIKSSGKFFENYAGGDESQILIHDEAIETADGYFYFFLAIPEICGNKNCSWLLFKFDNNNQQLSYIGSAEEEGDADIDGRINLGGYHFSPDKKKVAIESNGWGGSCYRSNDINILTFEKNNFQNIGNEYISEGYTIHKINSLNWIDDDCFTFSSIESRCEDSESISKEVKYCVSTNKIEIF